MECPEKTAEQLQETGSTDCIVVKGQMRIIAHAGNDVSYAIASIRDGLQAAMQDATFIQKLGMNFVRFLQYLGDSEEEALLPFVEDAIVDSDGDGVDDTTGSFPNIAETETVDSDGDTIIDNEDLFPNDPTEHKDKDDGGVGNNADAFPNDPTGTTDSDGDGVGDNTDAFLNDAAETTDSDGDGVGGNAGAFPSDPSEALDSDGDGVADNADAFPRDPFEWQDTDRDGVGDNGDAYPYDGTKTQDNRNGTEPIAVINEEEDDDSSVPLIFAFGLPLIVVLFLAGFFADKKKKAVVASALNNLRNSQFVGTGDPPKSYHEGLYHHLQNGARYLSTRCEQCRETRKNSFYVDDNLGTIREDEVYDDNMYGMDGNPSSDSSSGPQTGLATKFKGMDVHKCKSALCQRCNPPKKQRIQFLPTGLRRENNQDSPKSDERSDVPFSSDDFATKLEYFSERSEV